MAITIEHNPPAMSFADFHRLDVECFPDEPVDLPALQQFLSRDFWAAWDSGLLVGYCTSHKKPGLIWLRRIGVTSSHRRQGIGRRLMEKVVDNSIRVGLPKIMLFVLDDNLPAIRLYEAFGFHKTETTCQYVISTTRLQELTRRQPQIPITAHTIDQVAPDAMPPLPEEWADIRSLHAPPHQYVLVFRDQAATVLGYCRLTPGFPGCFPFVISKPSVNFPSALRELKAFLLPEKEILKFTFSDAELAATCDSLGLKLNYRLLKMIRSGPLPLHRS